jgi:hypothetical protein
VIEMQQNAERLEASAFLLKFLADVEKFDSLQAFEKPLRFFSTLRELIDSNGNPFTFR